MTPYSIVRAIMDEAEKTKQAAHRCQTAHTLALTLTGGSDMLAAHRVDICTACICCALRYCYTPTAALLSTIAVLRSFIRMLFILIFTATLLSTDNAACSALLYTLSTLATGICSNSLH